jgi:predicted RNA-binding Zn-ribbon protein involved in translation (DUF1610 family)
MSCPHCGADHSNIKFFYCPECGKMIRSICTSCGKVVSEKTCDCTKEEAGGDAG